MVTTVTIEFTWRNEETSKKTFILDAYVVNYVDDFVGDRRGVSYEIVCVDIDGAPNVLAGDFDDLVSFRDFAEKVAKYGPAYGIRYEDVGDSDFDEEFEGEWGSSDEFASSQIDKYDQDIPEFLTPYIDWDKWVEDIMMDYSSYASKYGVYIFRSKQ